MNTTERENLIRDLIVSSGMITIFLMYVIKVRNINRFLSWVRGYWGECVRECCDYDSDSEDDLFEPIIVYSDSDMDPFLISGSQIVVESVSNNKPTESVPKKDVTFYDIKKHINRFQKVLCEMTQSDYSLL